MKFSEALATFMSRWKTALFAVLAALLWSFFWYLPWQHFLSSTWLRMGIALTIFIVPGFCIYGLLSDRDSSLSNHIVFGFVLSHLLIAGLGLFGRLFHTTFLMIQFSMVILGCISLFAYLFSRIAGEKRRWKITVTSTDALLALALIVSVLFVSFIVIQREIADDDVLYMVYLTNWKNSLQLDFNELVFGTGQLLHSRFWIMSAPFAQALLSDLSELPGTLILGGYYEPFLVIVAMISWYNLARTFRFSHRSASVSVILQLLFLLLLSEYIHPGAPFFNQLSADKATATYILGPVFIQSAVWAIDRPVKKNLVLFLLTGLSMMFMHPIALAYSVFIVGVFLLLNTDRINFRSRLIPFVILVAILLPQVVFRFAGARAGQGIPYNTADMNGMDTMISRLGNTPFYGINPASLEMKFPYETNLLIPLWILKWGWLLIPAVGLVFVVRKIRSDHTAQYIFSALLLGLLVGIPFTGWIIGYFLSAWMLERALWFFPFGLSTVFLLISLRDQTVFGRRLGLWLQGNKTSTRRTILPFSLLSVAALTIFLLFLRENGLPDFESFGNKIRRYEDIARVGNYLDRHASTQNVAIGSDVLNDLIPAVSWKSKLITFRTNDLSNMLYFPPEEVQQRIADRKTLFSETASPDVKLDLLRKYDVQFIVLTPPDRVLFDDLIAKYPDSIKMEKVNRFFVVQIKYE